MSSTVEVTATCKVVKHLINDQILFSFGNWEYLARVDVKVLRGYTTMQPITIMRISLIRQFVSKALEARE